MYETSDNEKERKVRLWAILGTVLFHALVFVALLFMAFRTPLPLPGEEGVEVNLGYSDQGMGDIQPLEPAEMPKASPPQQPSKNDEQVVTDKSADVPAITKSDKPKVKPAPVPVIEPVPQPTVNPNAIYKGKGTTTKTGGSEGTTGQPGDQGNPNGTPGSPNYTGSGGSGNGISYELGGRGVRSLPKPAYNSPEQGKIVVSIRVNREGKVTYAMAGAKGTNISEISLRQQAESAALRTVFAPDPDAPDEQRGTITYNFVKVR